MAQRICLFPGTFDPITKGHTDIIDRALGLFDSLIIGIGINSSKQPMFSIEQRIEWIERIYKNEPKIKVIAYEGLTIDCCKNALADAKLNAAQIDSIVMVGGSTRIPAVKEAVASARAAGPDHEITISTVNDEVFVLGDSMRIHQAIANLLANARTHTPAGTKIVVDILQDELETRISVSDTGPGLSESDQERAFERFFRADPSRVRVSGEGSGLGLAIVDAVMKAHGGSVEVKSKLGEGATFTIIFPQKEL